MSHIDLSDLRKMLPHLTRDERYELQQILLSDDKIWSPLPGPQEAAYYSKANVLGYGGAAGGGKTDLAIGKGLTQHQRVAIFRRDGTELAPIVDRIEALAGHRDTYNGSTRIWRDPVPGVQIDFGSCPNPGDERKYQGRPKDLLVCDEVTHFLENQVRYLMGWVRTTDTDQQTQTLLTFNPPEDSEGFWVVEYFAPWLDETYPIPAKYGELRWFISLPGNKDHEVEGPESVYYRGEKYIPQSRTFILSKVTDNPYYMDTGYVSQLQAMPEEMRERLLYASFKAAWKDNPQQVCPSAWVQAAMDRWVDVDRKPEMMALGVDVARGGKDRTAIARRHEGYWFDKPISYPGKETPDGPIVAGHVYAAMRDGAGANIDSIGVGSSPYDFLKEARLPVNGIDAGAAAPYTDRTGLFRFQNFRSYMWWHFRELLDPQYNVGMALPPDKALKKELTTPQWRAPGRLVMVESRDEIIKRLGRSADLATAYVQAGLDAPKMKQLPGVKAHGVKQQRRGHDPFDILKG